jgi:hypothetical protein
VRSAEAVDREECWAANAEMDIADAAEDVVRATWLREGCAGENAAYGCGVRAEWARGSWYARAHSSACLDGVGMALAASIDGHGYQVSRQAWLQSSCRMGGTAGFQLGSAQVAVGMDAARWAILAEAFARAPGLDSRIVMGLQGVEVDGTLAVVLGGARHGSAAVDTAHCLSPM